MTLLTISSLPLRHFFSISAQKFSRKKKLFTRVILAYVIIVITILNTSLFKKINARKNYTLIQGFCSQLL